MVIQESTGSGEMLGRRHGSTQAIPSSAERRTKTKEHEDRPPQHLAVKLYRTDDLVTVAAPMPGLGPGDIAIVVSPERRLVIIGRLCADDAGSCGTLKQPRKDVLLDEWDVGPYRREIDLPTDVDGEKATLTYGNGILVVAMPVATTTRPARLTLEKVSTTVRGGRTVQPNRRLGDMLTDARGFLDEWRDTRGAALVAGGAAVLFLAGRSVLRGAARRGLYALATGVVAPAIIARVRGAGAADRAARKPVSRRRSDNPVEEASWESFPASDPPSWTGSRARAFD